MTTDLPERTPVPRDDSERGAQSINRALALLKLFTAETPDLTLKEICAGTGLTMPTAHRMAKALRANGFLVQDPLTGRLGLGPAVVMLAFVVMRNSDTSRLVSLSTSHLEHLRTVTGETVGLHIPAVGGRLCVAEAESRHMMRMATGVGNILPWHAGAASKAILAFMPEEERERALAHTDTSPLTDATIAHLDVLRIALGVVRDHGYAISEGESVAGASAIAMPIRGADETVLAAINITGPSSRWTREHMMAALPELKTSANVIESLLGR
jgi:IclR family acetate operon transcriptional repressor